MNVAQIRDLIRSTLKSVGLWSPEAEELLLGTIAVESGFQHIRQLGGGPALSLWQIEPATAGDNCVNFLRHRSEMLFEIAAALRIDAKILYDPQVEDLEYLLENHMGFAIVMARLIYYRSPEPLSDEPHEMASLWKRCYNSEYGAGTEQDFLNAYEEWVV